jgi:hypothetical protein
VGRQFRCSFAVFRANTLRDLDQLETVRLDDEVDGQAAGWASLDRTYDGHQDAARFADARGPLLDVAADDVEGHVDIADALHGVLLLEVEELVRAEVEHLVSAGWCRRRGRPPSRGELGDHRADRSEGAVGEDALSCLHADVLEQSLASTSTGSTYR